MSTDLFMLTSLTKELSEQLNGARIDKIQQPEVDELRFFVRNNGKNHCLIVSCNSNAPRIHLTSSKKESPLKAPTFCMLLRKHLAISKIQNIEIFNNDRIVHVSFLARTEMKDECIYHLFVEIMSRYSNIVFCDENMKILDAVKHISFENTKNHIVLRGATYIPVSQPKTSYLLLENSFIQDFSGGDLHKFLQDNVSGFAGITISELIKNSGLENHCSQLTAEQEDTLLKKIQEYKNIFDTEQYSPCIIDSKDVFPFPYSSLNGDIEHFSSLSNALDKLNSAKDEQVRHKSKTKTFVQAVKRAKQRVNKNISLDLERINQSENMDMFKLYGELILSNIYLLSKGMKSFVCLNYYTQEDITIPLDDRLSPSKNSNSYFNKYNKLKRGKEFAEKKLVEDRLLLDYINSIENELNELKFEDSTANIEEELISIFALRKKQTKGKVRKEKPEPPYIYEYESFTILRGKNNIQNDEITFKIASSNDVWMHIKNEAGSHTVILTQGKTVPDNVLKIAGEITASTKTGNQEIDYTLRRNVKRQPNGHVGQVIFTNYQTMVSTPNSHENLLKKIKHI